MRTPLMIVTDLTRITGEALADGVAWVAVEAAELCRRKGWLSNWLSQDRESSPAPNE